MSNGHKAAMHLRSKVSRGGRIVLPRAVRKRLDVRAGDYLHYTLDARSVRLCKEIPQGAGDPFATFTEWGSAADEAAYADL
jgi:AbrB family looped-hinge helix DNA binding protein